MASMRAVVTGAAGFIGSHLTERLLSDGHAVVGIDDFSDYYPRRIKDQNLDVARENPRFEFYELDLVEDDLHDALDGADVVFHFASRSGIRPSRRNQLEHYLRDNVLATQRLLEPLVGSSIKRLVYASSSAVYGAAERFPTKESNIPSPLSAYGMTKLAGEHLVSQHAHNFNLPAVTLRYFYVYGPRQRPDMAVARFIHALTRGEEIEVFGDGEQTREFTFVSDAVEAAIKAAGAATLSKTFNIGSGSRATVNQVLAALEQITNRTAHKRHLPATPEDHRHTGASINQARHELSWEPRVALRDGLARQWSWFCEQSGVNRSHMTAVLAGV
jgi:nucleoside-diphosphate-sugar epimerase